MKKLTPEQVIKKFTDTHGNLYGYELMQYVTCDTPISVICNMHGEFSITPYEHWIGGGCSHIECRVEKTKKTKMERHGSASYNNPEKNKDTKVKNHGTCRYNNTEKIKATSMIRYGVDNPSKTKQAKDKISRANVENAKVRKEKTIQTNLIRYGYEWATMSAMIQDSTARYKRKTTILPSGKEVKTQGYEHIAIEELLLSGIKEEELILDDKPTIKYFWSVDDGYGDGKWHTYYPDIYIPHLNKVVEVKSTWTMDGNGTRPDWKSKNMAKIKYTKLAGYDIGVMIYG